MVADFSSPEATKNVLKIQSIGLMLVQKEVSTYEVLAKAPADAETESVVSEMHCDKEVNDFGFIVLIMTAEMETASWVGSLDKRILEFKRK